MQLGAPTGIEIRVVGVLQDGLLRLKACSATPLLPEWGESAWTFRKPPLWHERFKVLHPAQFFYAARLIVVQMHGRHWKFRY